MRKLIAGMKISIDGKIEGPDGPADWVAAWSDEYGMLSQVDACLLGGGMYPGYEEYWSGIQNDPDGPVSMNGNVPPPGEVEYARFIAQNPQYVLSSTLTSAAWPQTSFVRDLEGVAALKKQSGKDIYLVGGAQTTAGLVGAGLVDELRLITYPVIAGEGKALFTANEPPRGLELLKVQQLDGGRVSLVYGIS